MSAGAAQSCLVVWLTDLRSSLKCEGSALPTQQELPVFFASVYCAAHVPKTHHPHRTISTTHILTHSLPIHPTRAGRVAAASPLPPKVLLITGWGKHSRRKGESEVKDAVTGACHGYPGCIYPGCIYPLPTPNLPTTYPLTHFTPIPCPWTPTIHTPTRYPTHFPTHYLPTLPVTYSPQTCSAARVAPSPLRKGTRGRLRRTGAGSGGGCWGWRT